MIPHRFASDPIWLPAVIFGSMILLSIWMMIRGGGVKGVYPWNIGKKAHRQCFPMCYDRRGRLKEKYKCKKKQNSGNSGFWKIFRKKTK